MIFEPLDIAMMRGLTDRAYRVYVMQHLLLVDHHGVLRADWFDGVPLATSPEQLDALIECLGELRAKMTES